MDSNSKANSSTPAKDIDFKTVCDNMTACVYLTDADGKTIYVNRAYLECSGLTEEEVLGLTINEIQERKIFLCDINKTIRETGQPADAIGYITNADRYVYVSGVPIKDQEGRIKYILTNDKNSGDLLEIENQLNLLKKEQDKNLNELSYYRELGSQSDIIFKSSIMEELLNTAHIVASTDITVLLTGESGTGKELIANTIYSASKRKGQPYIKINCAAIPSELLESELFGYVEGAFTGASKGGKAGAFEMADHGTLFLDEIGELPYHVQAKLLRALQENEIVRVGSNQPIKLDIRIVAATNKDLWNEVQNGRFRDDLYYRLNVLPLHIAPLRERKDDIPYLVSHFLEIYGKRYDKTVTLENGSMNLLKSYMWPGNVRELQNLLERLVVINTSGIISKETIKQQLGMEEQVSGCETLKEAVKQTEIQMITEALRKYGSKRKAAAALGVDSSTLVKKCQKYGID